MKMFNAAHIEVKKDFTGDFQTNPYEAGWADEALFFIHVERLSGNQPTLVAAVEISHDGVHWAKEGTSSEVITRQGLHFIRVRHFGNWLRLDCNIGGQQPVFRLNIQLALKG